MPIDQWNLIRNTFASMDVYMRPICVNRTRHPAVLSNLCNYHEVYSPCSIWSPPSSFGGPLGSLWGPPIFLWGPLSSFWGPLSSSWSHPSQDNPSQDNCMLDKGTSDQRIAIRKKWPTVRTRRRWAYKPPTRHRIRIYLKPKLTVFHLGSYYIY